jgi:hypothetical protein
VEMIWWGRRSTPGQRLEEVGIHAHGHHEQLLGRHVVGSADVVVAVLGHRDDATQALGDSGLHLGEGVPAGFRVLLVGRLGVLHLDATVDRDRMVDRAEDGEAGLLDGEQAVAEALVVLHEVELVCDA